MNKSDTHSAELTPIILLSTRPTLVFQIPTISRSFNWQSVNTWSWIFVTISSVVVIWDICVWLLKTRHTLKLVKPIFNSMHHIVVFWFHFQKYESNHQPTSVILIYHFSITRGHDLLHTHLKPNYETDWHFENNTIRIC